MPLSAATERERLHTRKLSFNGYRRADGLWDIEGHLSDVKSYGFSNAYRGEIEPGEAVHDMWLRVTVGEDFLVQDIEAVTDAGPFQVCPDIAPNFKRMIGVRVGRGWRREVRARLGGTEGCTHLIELLGCLATVAFQTIYPTLVKKNPRRAGIGRPPLLDSCHAFRSDGEVVKRLMPDHYTGKT